MNQRCAGDSAKSRDGVWIDAESVKVEVQCSVGDPDCPNQESEAGRREEGGLDARVLSLGIDGAHGKEAMIRVLVFLFTCQSALRCRSVY